MGRLGVSYVVRVKVGKTDAAAPKHYWPRTMALSKKETTTEAKE
jgi:hypothetical protein